MTIRYYIHAWQGLLMFLAGLLSVCAAFAGYLQAGGGEELLRRALANLKSGRAQFDKPDFRWRRGEIVVTNLRHDDFQWPRQQPVARFSGLLAKELTVKLDLFPWPPAVESITVRGMPETAISVSEGFLQTGVLPPLRYENVPPIRFVDCNLRLNLGPVGPLQLSGCSGELRPGSTKEPRGSFSLRELNGKPFNFKLETLEDGRWVFTGDVIQINTREIKTAGSLFAGQLDPVSLLVRALFAGEMGAEGTVSSLRVTVQPATGARKFICDGEVGYRNLEFRLPKPAAEIGLPFWLDQLLGARESLWPRWMQVDAIRTGADGRVAFHMADGRLNFACDEGPGSAFTGVREGQVIPPLEALKGTVETDEHNRPKRIILRGFLGTELSFETHIEHNADRSRTYALLLEPRGMLPRTSYEAGAEAQRRPERALWRFASRATDFFDVPADQRPAAAGGRTLVAFEVEGEARHFPWPQGLPPGVRDISGHICAKGRFTDQQHLCVETVSLDDGATIVYGGEAVAGRDAGAFGPLWQALQELLGTPTPWELQNLTLRGRADIRFSSDLRWQRTEIEDLALLSGSLTHDGRTTDLAIAAPVLAALHTREAEFSDIGLSAVVPDKWKLRFHGVWKPDGSVGTFKLLEENVPFLLHPQREVLGPPFVSPDLRRVNRETIINITGGWSRREVRP